MSERAAYILAAAVIAAACIIIAGLALLTRQPDSEYPDGFDPDRARADLEAHLDDALNGGWQP